MFIMSAYYVTMAKIIIEYRYRTSETRKGRRNTHEMKYYLESLVDEMRSAGIASEYVDSAALDGEAHRVMINGKDVSSVLDGLDIRMPEADDCDPDMRPKIVTFGRPAKDWNRNVIEDIPDLLMKNAVSKVYADMNDNGTL